MRQILERDIAETFAAECFRTAEIYEQREKPQAADRLPGVFSWNLMYEKRQLAFRLHTMKKIYGKLIYGRCFD